MTICFMTTITRHLLFAFVVFHLSSAFQSKWMFGGFTHRDITLDALESVASKWLVEYARRELRHYSGQTADYTDELSENETRMLLLLKSYFGDKHNIAWLQYTNASKEICDANHDTDFDKATASNPDFHFDAERFVQSNLQISFLRNQTLDALRAEKFSVARRLLGTALHTMQDFYSHSNWVELYQPEIVHNVGTFRFVSGLRFANKSDPTCIRGESCGFFGGNKETLHPELNALNMLTSGYFPNQFDGRTGRPIKRPPNKCSHGGSFDRFNPCGGISKDDLNSPRSDLHQVAVTAAREASVVFLQKLRADLSNDRRFGHLLGLIVGPALIFVVNVANHSALFGRWAVETLTRSIDTPLPPDAFVLITHRALACVSIRTFVHAEDMRCALEELEHSASTPQCDEPRDLSLFADVAPNGSFVFLFAEDVEERATIERLIAMSRRVWHVFCAGLAANGSCGGRSAPSIGSLTLVVPNAASDPSSAIRLLTQSETGAEVLIALRQISFNVSAPLSQSFSFALDPSVSSFTMWLECAALSFCPDLSLADPSGRPVQPSMLSSTPAPCRQVLHVITSHKLREPSDLDVRQWDAKLTSESLIAGTSCSFEIRARSYLSVLVSAAIAQPYGLNDTGSTRPVVSGQLFLELGVSHPSLRLQSIAMLNSAGLPFSRHPVIATRRPLLFAAYLPVPNVPFRLQFDCLHVSNSLRIARIHQHLFEPTQIGLVLHEFDGMTFSVERNSSTPALFKLNATNFGPADQLTVSVDIPRDFIATLPVSAFRAKQNETVQFSVLIFALPDADYGTRAEIPIAVTGLSADNRQVLIIPVEVRPLIDDYFPPAVELLHHSYSSCAANYTYSDHSHTGCNSSFWALSFAFSDVGSGPHVIELTLQTASSDLSVSFKKAASFPRDDRINATLVALHTDWLSESGAAGVRYSARLDVSCCVRFVELQVRDRMGYSDRREVGFRRADPILAALRTDSCRRFSSTRRPQALSSVVVVIVISLGLFLAVVVCVSVVIVLLRKRQQSFNRVPNEERVELAPIPSKQEEPAGVLTRPQSEC